MTGNDGQGLFYSAYYFYQGERKVLALNQQYTSDKDLGQLRTIIPGKTSAGGGGGNNQPSDTTAPLVSSASVNGDTFILSFNENLDPTSVPLPADFMVKVNGKEQADPVNISISGSNISIVLVTAVKAGDIVTLSYQPGVNPILDLNGNRAAGFNDQTANTITSALVAPASDPSVASNIFTSTAFLYSGDDAVQTGMAPDTIQQNRAAVIRGLVFDRDGAPLTGVRITVLNHPEFGSTVSRLDGYFDMAVNGGGH